MAVKPDGTVIGWGYNYEGELAAESQDDLLLPQPIPGLSAVTSLVAGNYHNLALASRRPTSPCRRCRAPCR